MSSQIRSPLAVFALASVAVLAGCSHKAPPPNDAGLPGDSGIDAGVLDAGPDAGPSDAGLDGGIPTLALTQVLPVVGESGGSTQVTINGAAFVLGVSDTATGSQRLTTLKFGSNSVLDFQVIDDNTIDARTPPGIAGPTDVTLTNTNGTVVCHGCFTYFDPLFATGISPNNGPVRGGNVMTIQGSGFTADAHVLVGGQSSPQLTLVSSTVLQAVVPRASAPGPADVVVFSKNGIQTLRRAYQYVADLRVSGIAPLTGPLAGNTAVTLTGQGFDGASSVTFGGVPGTGLIVANSNQLTVNTPATAFAGAVDVEVATPRDAWTVRRGFTYVDVGTSLVAYAVFPHLGPAAGQNNVTVTGEGLNDAGLTVTFGGQAATVVSATANTAVVTVPARGLAPRVVDVVVTSGASSSTLTGGYTYQLQLSSIAPNQGPSTGGTAASVSGLDLPSDADVFIGTLQATVTGAVTESLAPVTTPAGSGGAPNDLWVRAHSDPENEAVLPGAFTYQESLAMGRVQPNTGAIAGGTLVSVVGAGFGDGTVVSFGPNIAKDIKIIDSHTLSCRTPRGDVGTVDVTATRLGQTDVAQGGFSYFDPRSISGGLSGGPLIGTLNVSVLDMTQGFVGNPIPFANVMLGIDSATPFTGLTDDRGQLTFSDPSLVKPQLVTVWKDGYQSTTVTAVSTENVTVLLTQTGGGQGSPTPPPPGPPPAIITGHVTGFKAPRILQANEVLEARAFVAFPSFFYTPPYFPPQHASQEKWVITQDGGDYLLFSFAGIIATYAYFGIHNTQTDAFEPYLLGMHRGIAANPDVPSTGEDIVLDIHLDMTVPVTVQGPITIDGGAATNDIYSWLDLGNEGFVPNPNNWGSGSAFSTSVSSTGSQLSFPNFPTLDGVNFIFLDHAHAANSYPTSDFFTRQPGDLTQGLTIGPLLPTPTLTDPTAASTQNGWDGTLSWTLQPGPLPDIVQAIIFEPTLAGNLTVWTVVLPGDQTQVTLPPDALASLKNTYAGQTLYIALEGARSSKFNYNQWTYDVLNGLGWTSNTIQLSEPFTP